MGRFTVQVVRKSPERTNDSTMQRFLEFLAQRALPSNSVWRATRIQRDEPRKLHLFGWKFSGLIEFTKMGGHRRLELIAKEKGVILERLAKAGNFEKWGEGRKWTITEIPNLEELPPMPDAPDEEPEDDVKTLTVGAGGALHVPTNFQEGMSVELVLQDDGTILLRAVEAEDAVMQDDEEVEKIAPPPARVEVSPYAHGLTDMMRLASDRTRMSILSILRGGERNVSELCDEVGMSQPAVSHHLALLRTTNLIEPRREGKHRYYSLTPKGKGLIENVTKVVQ